MSVFEAIVLGLVQGLTEFLPISSSGHLILVPWLFGWDEPGLSFDAALHLGSLSAVFAYFWRDLLNMLLAVPDALRKNVSLLRESSAHEAERDKSARLAWLLVLGSIPGGLVGLFAQDAIDDFFHSHEHQERSIFLIAIMLMAFAGLLFAADRSAKHERSIGQLGLKDALFVGVAQAIALFPGVSRSGITLTAGLFRGITRADAARFSFLLGAPLVTVAGGKGLYDLISDGAGGIGNGPLIAGMLASAVSGFAAIWVLLRFLQRSSTNVFVVYRLAAGVAILLILASGIR
ncbi:MAG: undecaprenyl-diphosphate phosphatase [Thermomicrobiales bacterium]|nr:undecaprenyl-diphosphate phosphatase [Thermomicrobiales bacterium]